MFLMVLLLANSFGSSQPVVADQKFETLNACVAAEPALIAKGDQLLGGQGIRIVAAACASKEVVDQLTGQEQTVK